MLSLSREMEAIQFNALEPLCFTIDIDQGPFKIKNTVCLGLDSSGKELQFYLIIDGKEVHRASITNLCQSFTLTPVTLDVCISDLQLENGMPRFRFKIDGCIDFLGKRCMPLIDQVVSLAHLTAAKVEEIIKSSQPGSIQVKVAEKGKDLQFLYTSPSPQQWSGAISGNGAQPFFK